MAMPGTSEQKLHPIINVTRQGTIDTRSPKQSVKRTRKPLGENPDAFNLRRLLSRGPHGQRRALGKKEQNAHECREDEDHERFVMALM